MPPIQNPVPAGAEIATDTHQASATPADVTVVIATFNRARFLPEAIDSLLAQSIPLRRLIVVDDGSTDDTPEVIKRFGNRIEYIRKANAGKAKALNLVLPSIDTEYVWFFDDDDAAYPDALANLLATLKSDCQLAFAFGDYDLAETEGPLLLARRRPIPYRYALKSEPWQRLHLLRECTLMMSGALLRTTCVREVGGLNEALVRGQDYDLMVRLASCFPFRFCRHSVYVWREHGGVRGTATEQHSPDDRVRAWARFNEPIGHFLQDQLPIDAFSPEPSPGQSALRKTFIIRAWALATKLPAAYAASNLIAAFSADEYSALDHEEIDLLTNLFHHDFVVFRRPIPIFSIIRIATSAPGFHGTRLLTKGIFWLGHRQSGARDRYNVFHAQRSFSAGHCCLEVLARSLVTSDRLGQGIDSTSKPRVKEYASRGKFRSSIWHPNTFTTMGKRRLMPCLFTAAGS